MQHERSRSSDENLDRFIPNRSAMDFDYAHYMLTGGKVKTEGTPPCSPPKEAYRNHLAGIFNMNRTRILAFKNKPSPAEGFQETLSPFCRPKSVKQRRRMIPQEPERILSAPEIIDDYYLNLLDWSCCNVIAIVLGNTVGLWNASTGTPSELVTFDDDFGPVQVSAGHQMGGILLLG